MTIPHLLGSRKKVCNQGCYLFEIVLMDRSKRAKILMDGSMQIMIQWIVKRKKKSMKWKEMFPMLTTVMRTKRMKMTEFRMLSKLVP